jgi:hypothetical protein
VRGATGSISNFVVEKKEKFTIILPLPLTGGDTGEGELKDMITPSLALPPQGGGEVVLNAKLS